MIEDRGNDMLAMLGAARAAVIPQHISTMRSLEVMQTGEIRRRTGSDDVFHHRVGLAEPRPAPGLDLNGPNTLERLQDAKRCRDLASMSDDLADREQHPEHASPEPLARTIGGDHPDMRTGGERQEATEEQALTRGLKI